MTRTARHGQATWPYPTFTFRRSRRISPAMQSFWVRSVIFGRGRVLFFKPKPFQYSVNPFQVLTALSGRYYRDSRLR